MKLGPRAVVSFLYKFEFVVELEKFIRVHSLFNTCPMMPVCVCVCVHAPLTVRPLLGVSEVGTVTHRGAAVLVACGLPLRPLHLPPYK